MTSRQILWAIALGFVGSWLWGVLQRRAPGFAAAGTDSGTILGELKAKTSYLVPTGSGMPQLSPSQYGADAAVTTGGGGKCGGCS